MAAARAWTAVADAVRLRLRVAPRARRNAVGGIAATADGPALKIAVTAPPEDGKANAAVIDLLARALGTAKSYLSVTAGAGAWTKTVRVAGDAATLATMLEALADGAGATAKGSKKR
jgi:uncharacterized protein YggU (UPF0235/DUF167 family)